MSMSSARKSGLLVSEIRPIEKRHGAKKLPLFIARVQAGFPSPGDDYIEKNLDLNELLIKNPAATFFVKVEGDSMVNAKIESGDTLIVDRAVEVKDGNIVIALINGELTVKRISIRNQRIFLHPENKSFKKIEITEEMDFDIWGVVTYIIHQA